MALTPIRVVVTDDSAVARKLVTEALSSDSDIEVVATARDGAEALKLVERYQPDVVVLDVEMPVMDGVETVTALRAVHPNRPIIMFSSLTTSGGQATLDALAAGANDYVAKPTQLGRATDAFEYIRNELNPKVKMWARRRPPAMTRTTRPRPSDPVPMTAVNSSVDIVAIGVSTGGPDALTQLLSALPANLPVPIVIVQHMPAIFTRLLAERLNAACALNVREGVDGAELKAGDVWIAPGNFHMCVAQRGNQRVLSISQGSPENSCRPSTDPLFRSVAQVYGLRCLGIVMTGMGRDGELGCSDIRQSGGRVVVQDEASSVVWGMPRAVAQAGLAHDVMNIPQIANEIIERSRRTPARNMGIAPGARTLEVVGS